MDCNHEQPEHALQGFASQVSAVPGDDVAVFVNTTANAVQVQAYRMGFDQGLGGRLVVQTDFLPAKVQAAPVVTPGIGTVTCRWSPTLTLNFVVDHRWPPGCYLLKLVGDAGQQQYVPLTVRDDNSASAFVIQNSVTTWQAYNLWGDYSLYYGRTPSGGSVASPTGPAPSPSIAPTPKPGPRVPPTSSATVPIALPPREPGRDLTYWTDVDLHERPYLLSQHRCLFSLGHDEYWSAAIRGGAQDALDLGTNLAFLGANACYRQIRLQDSPVGPNRLQVCYKDAARTPWRARTRR